MAKLKPRLLLVADVNDWVFIRTAGELQKYLKDFFEVSVITMDKRFDEDSFDHIYLFSWNILMTMKTKPKNPAKYSTGIRSHRAWR